MSAPFVIAIPGPFFWDGKLWAGSLDLAMEYETREKAERQMRRLGMPFRRVITRSWGKRLERQVTTSAQDRKDDAG